MAQSSDPGAGSFVASVTMRDIIGVTCTNLSFGTVHRIPLTVFTPADTVVVANTSNTAVATTTATGAVVSGGNPAVCTVTGTTTSTPATATAVLSSDTILLVNAAQSLSAALALSAFDSGVAAGSTGVFRIGGAMTLKTAGPSAAEAADGVFTSAPVTLTVSD
jgi:hypothetical protein